MPDFYDPDKSSSLARVCHFVWVYKYCYFPKKAHTKQKLKIKRKINFKKFSILCADRQHNVLNQDIECAH